MFLLIPLALAPSLVTALVLGDVCSNNANQTQTGTCDPTTLGTVSCRTPYPNCYKQNTPTCTNICGYDTCFQPGYIPGGTNWGTCVVANNVTFSGACVANSNCQNYTPTNHIDCNNNQCCCLSPYVENIQTNLCEEPIDVPPTDGCVQTSNCADVPFGTKYCDAGTCKFTCTGNYVKSPDGKSCVEPAGLSYGQPCVSNGNCNVTNGSGLCASLPGGNTTVCSIQSCSVNYVLSGDKKSCIEQNNVGQSCVSDGDCNVQDGNGECISGKCSLKDCVGDYVPNSNRTLCVEPSNVAPLHRCVSNENCAPISNGTVWCSYGTCTANICDPGYVKSNDFGSCLERTNAALGEACVKTSSCFKNMNGTTTCSLDQSKGYNVCQYSSCDNGYTIGNNNTTCTLSTNVGIGNPCSTTSSCATGTNGIISCTQPQTSSQTQQLPTLCLYTSCSPNFSLRQDQTACTPNSGLPDANKNLGNQIASLQGTKVSAETGLLLSRDFTKFVPENYIYDPAGLAFYQVDVSVAGGSNYSFYATPLVASQNGLDGAMVAISSIHDCSCSD
ncbi:hypothetical protein BCR33DRAFT_532471 [Rhizoclosmatium globosum]|uniref:Uncharacterized protein n=1 Tax=Rhizoclosmatium globosum TaxID=329046 RepID=A0A1Y2CUS2_9FUNG|nr:hypothetical protein BCR33DRAFT_532471 [Rhizoclosmatium globosum]|eukprot:ORY50584.1 hypothetical protein BCR33DRAFT_532471 [Rhizoclosmatium globosum]